MGQGPWGPDGVDLEVKKNLFSKWGGFGFYRVGGRSGSGLKKPQT